MIKNVYMANQDKTQHQLVEAAITLFGQHGFSAVSTRMLADHAQVNLASIKYHFGSKDGLYVGAIDAIIELMQPRLEMVTQIAAQAKNVAGNDPQRQALVMTQLVHTVLTAFLESPMMRTAIPFVLRELFVPGPHFEHLYAALPKRLHETLTDLVAWILKIDAQSEQAKIRTHAVVGQILIFHLGRPILLRRLQANDYDQAILEQIRQQVTISVLSSLELPHEL